MGLNAVWVSLCHQGMPRHASRPPFAVERRHTLPACMTCTLCSDRDTRRVSFAEPQRHDFCVRILAKFVRLVYGIAIIEPAGLVAGDGKHPDLDVLLGLLRELLDFTVRHPTTTVAGAASAAAVAQKEKLYRDLAASVGARLTPFVIETYGAWDNAAREFVLRVSKFNDAALTAMSSHDILYSMSCEVSIAVQRGNAQALLANYQCAEAANEPRFCVSLNGLPRASS